MLEWIAKYIGYAVTITAGIGTLYAALIRPLKKVLAGIAALDADMADVLCSQLTQAHDAVLRQGWCTTAEKERIGRIYTRYKSRGRNHLADRFLEDVLALPVAPMEKGG